MNTQPRFIPGPEYPDLFDGASPMLRPVPEELRIYTVEVDYEIRERECRTYELAARDAAEACRIAVKRAESRAASNEFDHDAGYVVWEEREPTEAEVMAWAAAQEVLS